MRLKEDFNQIILQETPGCLWLFGLFFALIGGIFVYGSLGGFVNFGAIPRWQIVLAFAMGAVAIAAGTWIIYQAPATRIIVDRELNIITHERRGLFGVQTQSYFFDTLKQFLLIEEADDEGALIWSLGMEMTDGELIRISSMPSHSEEFKRNFVFQIHQFMNKPLPSYQSTNLLEDESEPKIS